MVFRKGETMTIYELLKERKYEDALAECERVLAEDPENAKVWGSYAEEVENVRRFITERLTWMDNKLGFTYTPNGIKNATVDFAEPYQIYDLLGRSYTGSIRNLPQGLYIVKQGNNTKKIQVR